MHKTLLNHGAASALILFLLSGATLAVAAPGASSSGKSAAAPAHAAAAEISESTVIDASADTVWNTVDDFDSVSVWVPAIDTSTLTHGKNNTPGAVRHIVFTTDESADETLVAWDGARRSYTYRMTHGAFPMQDYTSTVAVQSIGPSKSRLIWEARFTPTAGSNAAPLTQAIRKIYIDGLQQVRQMVGVSQH